MRYLLAATLLYSLAIITSPAQAREVRSLCRTSPRYLPSYKTRHLSDQRLECTGNADSYIRRPQPMSYKEFESWRGNEVLGEEGRLEMYRERRKNTPEIKWSGSIPYSVVERWYWEEWVYGQAAVCGFEECMCTTDNKGDRSCSQCMKSCWHDEGRSEEWFCANEIMTYDANYYRPTEAEWNPKSVGYYDIIPNKYDLLPGEVEVVQAFNGEGTSMSPYLSIGDPWNKYDVKSRLRFDNGGSTVACVDGERFHFNASIVTEGRIIGKTTPNAFRAPVDENGNALEFISSWESSKEGKSGRPVELLLADTSAALIKTMAEQSRKFGAREKEKQEAGKLENVSSSETRSLENDSGFWKETDVKVQLFLDRAWAFDREMTTEYVTDDGKGIVPNFQHIFAQDDQKLNALWQIELNRDDRAFYRPNSMFWDKLYSGMELQLRPGKKYYFAVSMYQKGVPFYARSCEEQAGWDCRFGMRDYFSKPLKIEFVFDKNNDDKRGIFTRTLNWLGDKW